MKNTQHDNNINPRVWKVSQNGTGNTNLQYQSYSEGIAYVSYHELPEDNFTFSGNYNNNLAENQIAMFKSEVQIGDYVIIPKKNLHAAFLARVTGEYEYHDDNSTVPRRRAISPVSSFGDFELTNLKNHEKWKQQTIELLEYNSEADLWADFNLSDENDKNKVNFLSYEELEKVLSFFVKTAQLKILTKVDPDKTTASSFYHEGDSRTNTKNNNLGLQLDSWKDNISAYDDVNEQWFQEGVECIHFSNGNAQNRNYSWRNASIHLSTDNKYAVELMFGMDVANGDNLINSLDAKLFNLYDIDGNHNTNKNAYTSVKGEELLFSIPVSVSLKESGEIDDFNIDLSRDVYATLTTYLSQISNYFTNAKNEVIDVENYKNKYSKTLLNSKNIIFRGAPGTGKSYLAKSIAADIISGGSTSEFDELTKEQLQQIEFVQFHPSYDYTDFVEGLRPKSNADGSIGFSLESGVFKKFVSKAIRNYTNAQKNIETLSKEKLVKKMMDEFFINLDLECNEFKTLMGNSFYITEVSEDKIKLTTPADSVIKSLTINLLEIKTMLESGEEFNQVKDVTKFFGKSYTAHYFPYYLAIFKEIKAQPYVDDNNRSERKLEKKYVFIIDEINRGEISKIFGELFFSIDPGYRGVAGSVSTQYANLHNEDEEKFYVPDNVYIIGTMNDIDRSVDSFDFAMRRRFRFINIKADEQLDMLNILDDKDEVVKRMVRLNQSITSIEGLNENYHIGAAYFLKLKDIGVDSLWCDYLEPLLHDYVRGLYNESDILVEFKKAYDLKD